MHFFRVKTTAGFDVVVNVEKITFVCPTENGKPCIYFEDGNKFILDGSFEVLNATLKSYRVF